MLRTRYCLSLLTLIIFSSTAPLCAQGGAPINDHCQDVAPAALAVDSTVVFTGNTVGATIDGDNVPGSGLDAFNVPVVWVAFTTTQCSDITISFCGSTTAYLDQYFWEVITPQCPADQLIVSADYNNTECPDGQPVIHHHDLPAGTYYYPVWADQNDPIGDYMISISANACAPTGPANDLCSGATAHALAIGDTLTLTGDNTGATDSDGLGYAGVWESFTLSHCANVTVDYCGATGFEVYAYGIYSNCPANTLVDTTAAGTCTDGNLIETFEGLAPGTYWIPIRASDNALGAYAVNVAASACFGPFNDYCDGAEPHDLALGDTLLISGDNTGATDNEGLGFANVWESFMISECADVTVDYCSTAGFNSFAYGIYSDCPATTFIDTTASNTCMDGNTSETFEGLAPGTYWIPVMMVADSAEGTYSIHVIATACSMAVTPPNDDCAGATPHDLAVGDTLLIIGDNTGATDSEGLGYAGVWESFTTSACANVIVDYCGTTPAFAAFAPGLYADCPPSTIIGMTGIPADTCENGSFRESFDGLAPGTYWIPVLAHFDAEGPYVINVIAAACDSTTVPANDLCADAVEVNVVAPDSCATGTVEGDNTGATGTGEEPACGALGTSWQDVWFTFHTAAYAQVMITLTPGTISGAGMEIFPSCGHSSIACSGDGSVIDLAVMPDTNYFVRVFTQGIEGMPGTFELCITGDPGSGIGVMDQNRLRISPNPGTGNITLVPSSSTREAVITIFDMTGRPVYMERTGLLIGDAHLIQLSGTLKSGSYLLQLTTPQGSAVGRVMVK